MTETMNRWDRFNNFLNKTLIPLSWVTLSLGLFAIVLSVVHSDYDLTFWLAVGLTIWSAYDVVKYYWRKRNPEVACDHSRD